MGSFHGSGSAGASGHNRSRGDRNSDRTGEPETGKQAQSRMQDTQRPISKECPVCGESFEPDAVGSRCPIDGSLLLVRSDHPLIGQVVAGRYRVVEMVGTGGWSFVFRAEHVSLSRTYAVKVLHAHLSNVGDNLRRFQHEAEAASRLNHPNIASVYDYGLLNNGQPYLVMDYLEGRSLHDLLDAQGGTLP